MRIDPDEPAKTAAIDFARRLVPRWQESLSIELLGAYLIGSLAHAGFSRRYSDIDIALVTAAGLSPSERCAGQNMNGAGRASFGTLHPLRLNGLCLTRYDASSW